MKTKILLILCLFLQACYYFQGELINDSPKPFYIDNLYKYAKYNITDDRVFGPKILDSIKRTSFIAITNFTNEYQLSITNIDEFTFGITKNIIYTSYDNLKNDILKLCKLLHDSDEFDIQLSSEQVFVKRYDSEIIGLKFKNTELFILESYIYKL